ncbi:MAG TPA: crossover junction endodeoxyribonuclease RuvC [Candidatus Melainabacteria bacterium]|nr:crossover junction endodeoxyribonuclease RuvC [Candidatus Melainabacteria bacterium]
MTEPTFNFSENSAFSSGPRPFTIMGIDPGTATVGYGVVQFTPRDQFEYIASGTIQTPSTMSAGKRLSMIRADLMELITSFKPDILSVEAIFFFKNAKTVVPVAQARGIILEVAASFDLDTFEYTPMQVKLQIAGFGRAEKPVVQQAVARLLNLKEIIRPDDASDALALAVCHARMSHVVDTSMKTATVIKVAETIRTERPRRHRTVKKT